MRCAVFQDVSGGKTRCLTFTGSNIMRRMLSISHITSGFIAILVGYTSSAAIVFQAAAAAGATTEQISSWLWALGIGMFLTTVGLSLRFKTPVLTAWSTPGAALLATSLVGVSMGDAVGAFMFASVLTILVGVFGWFDQIMQRVPKSLSAALLAGVLVKFGLGLFVAMRTQAALAVVMLLCYLVGRRLWPRYAVPVAFLLGLLMSGAFGLIHMEAVNLDVTVPVWTAPSFSLAAWIGVGLPLFVVTMTGQNMPGMAVLRANGYQTPASPIVTWTGLAGLLLAPFGGYAFNLAAITAAICMSPEADPQPAERYRAAVWAGMFYLLTGLFGATMASLFTALPQELIAAIAGLALLATIGNALTGALAVEAERDAALVTFLCTASGLSMFGIGSAFWGLVFGLVVRWIMTVRQSN